jgi:two-component system cell cycle response regulator DivK
MTTILHIEDTKANQILVQRVLEAEGYQIINAADGKTGIQAAMAQAPDLILIDMGLPDIDGQTVVTHLKQLPSLNAVPMVAITAWPAEKALETADRYSLSGCILKPIDVRNFPRQIAGYLGSAS